MINNLKALLVVLVLAGVVFHLARPLCIRFMSDEDFVRRRNLWLMLSVAAFASPSFWIFAAAAAVLCARAARSDPSPVAVFLIAISAAPPMTLPVPGGIIEWLFDLNLPRLLALVVLLPVAVRCWGRPRSGAHVPTLKLIDFCVVGLMLLQMAVQLPHNTVTNILRHGLHFLLDYGIVYYVMSRTLSKQAELYEALAVYALSCAVLAPISLFETTRGWLLYLELTSMWGNPDPFAWLFRDGSLRARATADHSLTFGFHLALAFGFVLALARSIDRPKAGFVAGALMWVGLISAYSRAPWLVAGVFALLLAALSPGAGTNVKRLMLFVAVGGGLLFASPWGDNVLDVLPFIGTVDSDNVTYRQQLAETSWRLILQNPLLGDPLVMRDMEELRQGQGIIDLVNAYASVALFNGLIGLTFFVLPLLAATWTAYRISRARSDVPADKLLGAVLTSAMCATLFYISTAGFERMLYVLLGMLTAYIALDRREVTPVEPLPRERAPLANPAVARPYRTG